MQAEDFTETGRDYYEYSEECCGRILDYHIWHYVRRSGFSRWCLRVTCEGDIVFLYEPGFLTSFDEALALATQFSRDAHLGLESGF